MIEHINIIHRVYPQSKTQPCNQYKNDKYCIIPLITIFRLSVNIITDSQYQEQEENNKVYH